MKKKRDTCNEPKLSGPLHDSIRIGGQIVLGRCEREVLPGMTVCAWHASPDAVTIQMRRLARGDA